MSPEINCDRAGGRCEVLLLKPEVTAVAPEPMHEKDRRPVSGSRLMIGKSDSVSDHLHRAKICAHSLLPPSSVLHRSLTATQTVLAVTCNRLSYGAFFGLLSGGGPRRPEGRSIRELHGVTRSGNRVVRVAENGPMIHGG
jgi:hypothetical protein